MSSPFQSFACGQRPQYNLIKPARSQDSLRHILPTALADSLHSLVKRNAVVTKVLRTGDTLQIKGQTVGTAGNMVLFEVEREGKHFVFPLGVYRKPKADQLVRWFARSLKRTLGT